MRIAFDPQAFRLQRNGGISRYIVKLSMELLELGETVRIFSPGKTNAYLQNLAVEARRISPLNAFFGSLHPRIERLSEPLLTAGLRGELRRWKPSILHETYYQEKRDAPRGCPVVLTVYDMIHEIFPEAFDASNPTAAWKKAAVKRADHIICISESTRRDLIRILDVPPSKLSVVLLGVDKPAYTSSGAENPAAWGKPYLLYVGLREGYKNFGRLLDAYASKAELRDNYDLVAFGGGPFGRDETARIEALGLAGKVRQEGGNDQRLLQLYREAAAFVYPSLYEGFGLPPLEAMSQGCPVVSSNTSSMPEVIGDAAEFFDPLDTDSIASSLVKVLESPSYSAELKRRGNLRASDFPWRSCALRTREVYRGICGCAY